MIDFATLQGLTIPEGVVTEIKDASGRVLWTAQTGNEPAAIFEVAKQTKTTYAGETKYENEQFILLDIYPKKGGTVKVTYGGLTKTIKDTSGADEPNAQQVFFGTFNGVSDSVITPASGRLTIEGAYRGYGLGSFGAYANKSSGTYAPCITNVIDFGNPVYIGIRTFEGCANIVTASLPSGLTYLGPRAFYGCTNLSRISLPSGVTEISSYTFCNCSALTSVEITDSTHSIGDYAFQNCISLNKIPICSGITSIGQYAFCGCSGLKSIDLAEGLVSIGDRAFQLCKESEFSSLPMYNGSVVIPSTVQSIGVQAFSTKSSNSMAVNAPAYLGTVRFLSTTPPILYKDDGEPYFERCFGLCEGKGNRTLIAPAGCYQTYLNTVQYQGVSDYAIEYWSVVEAS